MNNFLGQLVESAFSRFPWGGGDYRAVNKNRNPDDCVFNYDFMMSLKEKDYPKYLSKAYFIKTGKKLNLRKPETLNEKIQWLKIYDNLPIKAQLTDKVLVRDWVKDKIGEEYLKPVLQICDKFEDIDFDKLPESFIIKCNHGCKWNVVVRKKKEYLNNKKIYNISMKIINNWLSQTFFGYSDFETQYKNITPKIIIEPLMRENADAEGKEKEIYIFCFNSLPKIFHRYEFDTEKNKRVYTTLDENYDYVNIFSNTEAKEADNILKQAVELSKKLAENFKFVRVDWFIFKEKLYFEEMTFTPLSGYINFVDKDLDIKLGNMLSLKGA